jgi:PAS domain S-box-containing protein
VHHPRHQHPQTSGTHLAEERNLLRTVIDAVPDYIYVKDTQHRMMLNNLAHVRATGMSSPGEMLGKTDFDLFPPDMAMKFHIDEVRVLNTGTPQHNLEEQTLNAEGNAIWALTTKVPLRNLQGEIVGLVGITHDITKLKASEQALRESEELYRTTIAAMTEGITLQKRDGSFTFCNVSAENILGLTNDQVMGRTRIDPRWRITYEDGTRFPEEAQPAMLALRTGFPQPNVVMGVQNPDGSVRWILANAQPLFDPTQAMPTSVVTTFSDITERKRTEAALEEKHQQELLLQQQLKTLHEITIQLTRAETLDDFYRSIVEHGIQSFGFERMGLLLYDTERDLAMGTYGTDAHGQIMDERGLTLNTTDLTGVLKRTLNRSERFAFDADVPLYSNMQEVGRGDNVVAALWNGEALGWLCVDNLIHHKPITKTQQDILALYALTAGSLLSRKRAEFALRESEERYQSVVQTQSELICRYQPDLTLTFVNNAYCRYFNHSAEEIIGKSFLETIPESEREDVKAFYEKLVRTKGSVTYEHHVIMDDGSIRWQLWTDTTVVNESDEVVAIQAVGLDITDRKQAENALRESEKKFRSFIESAPISVLITDPNGEIVLANTEAVKVFGYPQTELIGQSIELLVPDSEKRQHVNSRTHYTLAPESRRMGGLQVRARRKDGSHFPCEVQLSYVETHPTPLVMGFILDVTQQKEAELTLKQALAQEKELGELKSRFVSMASHEFRTPLAAILATTETLTIYRDKMNAQQIDIRLDKIRQQVMHMKDIMEDVLQLARIQAGRVKYEPTLGNLDMLCSEIIEEFENQSQYTGRITYTGVKLPELMFFDQRLMRQVITNVIGNALKYSSKEKPVYVDLQQNAAEIVLKVKDEGIGIPVEDIKHLFEPFHRAKNVGTISGTGLGMSISKQAVEIHGGTIMPESEVGVGTTMTIVLPLVSATISARTQDTE